MNSENKIKIKVEPYYVYNGSNRIIWSSDTQYLPRSEFSDINYMYDALMNYVTNEYKNKNMAYMIHTGDVVDDNPDYGASAIAQFENATKAFKILDDDNVPYGVCAGNHDVGTALSKINYVNFSNYFGNDRFKDSNVFTGSLNNNECHYDLITIGAYDFIVLYLGFGKEANDETIIWANKVLKQYKHRNAIIATHAYLNANGALDESVQAKQIYDNIVVPNENVKFVFCGHTDGNAINKHYIEGSEGRYVYELLNCYQFVETKAYTIFHLINGYKCNGEAFIKEIIFKDNKVYGHTFSPVVDTLNPYGINDDFELDVDLYQANRSLTSKSFKAYQITSQMLYQNDNASSINKIDGLSSSLQYIAIAKDDKDLKGFILI